MKKILLASAAAAVMSGSAYAAEPLEPIAPPPPPAVEPFVVPTWAGPYVGADIGWGWADHGDDDRHNGFFNNGFFNNNGIFHDDGDDADGLVGGVFAGWLGQNGSFLYGVEIFGQLADLDADRHHRRRFDGLFVGTAADFDWNPATGQCFFDPNGPAGAGDRVACPGLFARGVEIQALAGLEGVIGWGGDRAAFLLHAGPALGWFGREDDDHRFFGAGFNSGDPDFDAFVLSHRGRGDDDDDIEFGLSVAAEGRFKLTERVFAGVIGRAFWFPDVGDDDDRHRFNTAFHDDDDEDVTVFEVKARLGVMFGQPPAAAPMGPVEAAF